MATKTYNLNVRGETVQIIHNDGDNDEICDLTERNYYPPDDNLKLVVNGKELPYGTSEFLLEAERLNLPEFDGLNLRLWSETVHWDEPSAHPYLPRGFYRYNSVTLGVGVTGCTSWDSDVYYGGKRTVEDEGCDGRVDEVDIEGDNSGDLKRRERSAVEAFSDNFAYATRIPHLAQKVRKAELQREREKVAEKKRLAALVESRERVGEARKAEFQAAIGRSKAKEASTQVFFKTGDAILGPEARRALERIVSQNKDATQWVLEGFCDPRGSETLNYELGLKRADTVAAFIREKLTKLRIDSRNVRITTVSYGESRASAKVLPTDRRVNVLAHADPISRALTAAVSETTPGAPSTTFLLDNSGSMTDLADHVIYYPYPDGSQFYLLNRCSTAIGPEVKIDGPYKYELCGGTPLWQRLLEVLEELPQDASLTLVTDGIADSPTVYWKGQWVAGATAVVERAKEKGIRVAMVHIGGGLTTDQALTLGRVALETGGRYYFVHTTL